LDGKNALPELSGIGFALRRQVSLVLPFGQPVGPDHQLVLILDALALRRRVSPVLLLSAVWRSWSRLTLDP
jgi:hypothetical protein